MSLARLLTVALGWGFVCVFVSAMPVGCSPSASGGDDAGTETDSGSGTCPDVPCPEGEWCFNNRCEPCNTDTHCGPKCTDCTQTDHPVCMADQCWCTDDQQCGPGSWCNEGDCQVCADDDPEHCGETCAVCSGEAPACVDGMCGCESGQDCGQGAWCNEDALCEPCDTAEHCGAECVACPADAPTCHAGQCVECVDGSDCAAGQWCSDEGRCETCADDDPEHCGSDCTVCSDDTPDCVDGVCVCTETSCHDYYRCATNGTCVLCDTVDHCGVSCEPCVSPTPFCRQDGRMCVECLSNTDCPEADTHCEDNACVPDCLAEGCATDDTPSGEECAQAKIVGRTDAMSVALYSGDTTGDGNDDDLSSGGGDCYDAKYDNFYRIYLLAGDQLDVELHGLDGDFDAMLKLYEGTDCAANGDTDLVGCYQSGYDGDPESLTHVAGSDGWYTIVVDGRYAFADHYDYGGYDLDISLTCVEVDCCCL